MKNAKKSSNKNLSYVMRFGMTVLTVILIVLFFSIMIMVGQIQGTARIVNYAGLVRGGTQRMVKLENAGQPQDKMRDTIASYIDGLRNGSDELNFVRLNDKAFQNKMVELDEYFQKLTQEIDLVREKGYENTDIISMSENFFHICDEATGLAEDYSQKKATSLDHLEKVVIVDIAGLIILIAGELIRALRFAAQNRILQKKVYLDEATGLPNKNKCEEILDGAETSETEETQNIAVCVFDLNNLRTINNNLGHEKGDEYIRSFAILLREAVPQEHFVGRDGGDEFIAVLKGLDDQGIRDCLQGVRNHTDEYSRSHPEMPISYAAGYASMVDFEGSTLRDLFRYADKNMYIDKNRAKMQEAADRQKVDQEIRDRVKAQGYDFSACLYCNARLDEYRILRVGADFILAEDGSYSGAVEQIVEDFSSGETRRSLREKLQISYLDEHLTKDNGKIEIPYQYQKQDKIQYGKMTILFINSAEDGRLHHFVVGFEDFQDSTETAVSEKTRLTRYYEQLRQSIVENGNYADALLETAEAGYMVNLTEDRMEQIFYHTGILGFLTEMQLPCSYNEYSRKRTSYIAEETRETYRIVDSTDKLLERFATGAKQIVVEFREKVEDGKFVWIQKTVLMSRDVLYDRTTGMEKTVVHGIMLFKDTSAFHEKEVQENERLQEAFEKADSASKAKTEFMNRMSHDIRTPINGIMGMLNIIRKNRDDAEKMDESLQKLELSASHLLALVNDVLDMSKLESGNCKLKQESFDLETLANEVASLVDAQMMETGMTHRRHRGYMEHTALVGDALQLQRIMLNFLSNSIKYNKPGGAVDTYIEEISCDGTTAVYEFRITDTGIGMSEEFVKNKLFRPFNQEENSARTQYRGTGLGMSIVKSLIDQMQGSIEVESTLGVGTTFTYRLPFLIDRNKHQILKKDLLPDGKELSGEKILLVEDNDINMEIAEFYLTEHGAAVEKAWNGKEAVEKFNASAPREFSVVLMDVMMPVMDGLEAAKAIRALDRPDAKEVVILAMTAQTAAECVENCREAGMNGHISKPVEAGQLVKQILENL